MRDTVRGLDKRDQGAKELGTSSQQMEGRESDSIHPFQGPGRNKRGTNTIPVCMDNFGKNT